MGCCFSVDSEASKLQKKEKGFSRESRAPPPSAEEETVKEVLSEIPNPKSKLEPVLIIGGDIKQEVEETKDVQKTVHAKIQENHHHKHLHRDVNENVKRQELETNEENMSEASEICSLSLSMSESVSTTTVTDKIDNNEEEQEVRQQYHQHRVSRSPAKLPTRNREYGVRRDRVVGQSPSRRSEQSPGKRNFNEGSARLVQNSSSREESGQPTARRGGSMPDPRRKDPGECSGRRSRSPAITRSATMNRTPSTRRRTNQSPGRVTETGMKKPEGNRNESLENPLVSLECFIFL